MLGQHIEARAQRVSAPQVAWHPWAVIARGSGTFVVSRESGGGTQRQFLKNSVGKATIFRKAATAQAACDAANRAAP